MDPYLAILIKIAIALSGIQLTLLGSIIYKLGKLDGRVSSVEIQSKTCFTRSKRHEEPYS